MKRATLILLPILALLGCEQTSGSPVTQRSLWAISIGMSEQQLNVLVGQGDVRGWEYSRNGTTEFVFFSNDRTVTGYTIKPANGPQRSWATDMPIPNMPRMEMRTDRGVRPGMSPEQVRALMGAPSRFYETYEIDGEPYAAEFVGGGLTKFWKVPPPPPKTD
jgi:hypothetical protein